MITSAKRWKWSAAESATTVFIRWKSHYRIRTARRHIFSDARGAPVAGDGSHRYCSVDGGLADKVQTQLGLLVVPAEQRALDRVGLERSRLRPHRPPTLPRIPQHPRRVEESNLGREACLLTLLTRSYKTFATTTTHI